MSPPEANTPAPGQEGIRREVAFTGWFGQGIFPESPESSYYINHHLRSSNPYVGLTPEPCFLICIELCILAGVVVKLGLSSYHHQMIIIPSSSSSSSSSSFSLRSLLPHQLKCGRSCYSEEDDTYVACRRDTRSNTNTSVPTVRWIMRFSKAERSPSPYHHTSTKTNTTPTQTSDNPNAIVSVVAIDSGSTSSSKMNDSESNRNTNTYGTSNGNGKFKNIVMMGVV